jgi:hypothetical protein
MDNKTDINPPIRTIRRRQRWPDHIADKLWELASLGRSPAQIYADLKQEFGTANVPSPKTIERHIKNRPKGEPWTIIGADAEDAGLVLPVLAYVAWITDGRIQSVTKGEARWIARIRRLRPDLMETGGDPTEPSGALGVFFLALDYAEREQTGEFTEDLDAFLIWAPWQRRNDYELLKYKTYRDLVAKGTIPNARHGRFLDEISPVQYRYVTKKELETAAKEHAEERKEYAAVLAKEQEEIRAAEARRRERWRGKGGTE